jgi:hypothetical protein
VLRPVIRFMLDRLPYIGRLRQQVRDAGSYPAGHFYSPIPTQIDIAARLQSLETKTNGLPDLDLNTEKQLALLERFQAFYAELPFPEKKSSDYRYYFDQKVFCYADAIFLYSFLRHVQPKRIIEVGSGFSSAVILDTVDKFFAHSPQITFIEPFPVTLKQLLRPRDQSRVTLIEEKVQQVPLETFKSLQAGDLLFIDSSHVVKCGSDVQFLMFEALPRLPIGTFVHFHDVFDSFEYPRQWLVRGWYWNEDYILRAFLSHNNAWEIYLFGNYAVRAFREVFAQKMPLCLKNPGGSLYIRRVA